MSEALKSMRRLLKDPDLRVVDVETALREAAAERAIERARERSEDARPRKWRRTISLPPETYLRFRLSCREANVPMAAVLQLMVERFLGNKHPMTHLQAVRHLDRMRKAAKSKGAA